MAARRMPAYRNSMALEIEAILGHVVARAQTLEAAVPRLHTRYTLTPYGRARPAMVECRAWAMACGERVVFTGTQHYNAGFPALEEV